MPTSGIYQARKKWSHLDALFVALSQDGANVFEVGRLLVFSQFDGSRALDDGLCAFLFADEGCAAIRYIILVSNCLEELK